MRGLPAECCPADAAAVNWTNTINSFVFLHPTPTLRTADSAPGWHRTIIVSTAIIIILYQHFLYGLMYRNISCLLLLLLLTSSGFRADRESGEDEDMHGGPGWVISAM